MTNNSLSGGGTPAVDSEALGEWVAETAAQKGISERELLDEILSSYWVLEELSDVIVDSESEPAVESSHTAEGREPAGEQSPTREDPGREASAAHGEPQPQPESVPRTTNPPSTSRSEPSSNGRNDHPSTGRSDSSPAEGANSAEDDIAISRTFHYRAGGDEAEKSDEELELSGIEQELEKLRTVIDELSDTESLPTPESTDGGERTDPTDGSTEGSLPEAEAADAAAQSTAEPWSEHSGAIAELDDELVEIRNQLSELEADLTRKIDETADAHEELEGWIENEFDNIEDVLQHLLSTTDNLEYRIGSAVDSHREQLEPLQTAHAEQEQLTEIKDEAIRKGVDTAECEACEERIDLGVLPSPHCPNCEQRFTGVEGAPKWNPFSTSTLRTTPQRRRESPTSTPDTNTPNSHDQRSTAGDQRSETPEFQQSQPPSETDQDHRTDSESNWG